MQWRFVSHGQKKKRQTFYRYNIELLNRPNWVHIVYLFSGCKKLFLSFFLCQRSNTIDCVAIDFLSASFIPLWFDVPLRWVSFIGSTVNCSVIKSQLLPSTSLLLLLLLLCSCLSIHRPVCHLMSLHVKWNTLSVQINYIRGLCDHVRRAAAGSRSFGTSRHRHRHTMRHTNDAYYDLRCRLF